VYKKLTENLGPFGKKSQKTAGGIFWLTLYIHVRGRKNISRKSIAEYV